ncbi:MarR family winged helix-turn-helix transcriptional regulator [Furfurilactobacillus siliginis]|uniref:HTH marR-type domain-containing protein n=1 Tax=Furfurilactobacillus siliginis TaxID=348151 RepID=A0A0R2L434_9LACO|nr:MarR family transcriptional regulator [Furfurilactobacillus siliginis]KRN96414.1 hypothetical protein IV55_GL001382 [Furfurilactobacillus siliginis]GEK29523.1 hypothetical protein LSI01_18340 [Furfurilactobacillus siliginis]
MAKVTTEIVARQLKQTLQHVRRNDNTLLNAQTAPHIGAQQLSLTQLQILHLIATNTLPVTNSLIATTFNISKPAVTKAIHKLADAKLITSIVSEDDHRITTFALTETGHTIANEFNDTNATIEQTYAELAAPFGKSDRKVILKFLTALDAAIDAGKPF